MARLLLYVSSDRDEAAEWHPRDVVISCSQEARMIVDILGPCVCVWPAWSAEPVPEPGLWVWGGRLGAPRRGGLVIVREELRRATVYELEAAARGDAVWPTVPTLALIDGGNVATLGRVATFLHLVRPEEDEGTFACARCLRLLSPAHPDGAAWCPEHGWRYRDTDAAERAERAGES